MPCPVMTIRSAIPRSDLSRRHVLGDLIGIDMPPAQSTKCFTMTADDDIGMPKSFSFSAVHRPGYSPHSVCPVRHALLR